MVRNHIRMFALLLSAAVLLAGCAEPTGSDNTTGNVTANGDSANLIPSGTAGEPVHGDFEKTDDEMFAAADYQTHWDSAVTVTLQDGNVTSSSDSVGVSGTIVMVTGAATYVLSGRLSDGMLVVDAGKSDTVHLVLSGVSVHSQTSAALYIRKAGKVIVTLAEGTENVLSNGGSFQAVDESAIDGAVFSKKDLTFNGSGSLQIQSPAGHGIVCKDNLAITGGSYTVNSAGHGLDANDSIRIGKASLTINAGQDGVHAETADDPTLGFVYLSGTTVTVTATGDGISAGGWLQMESGRYDLTCGGGFENGEEHNDSFGPPGSPGGQPPGGHRAADTAEDSVSSKGLKAAAGLAVNGGTVKIDAADDAIHSDLSLVINGGSLTVASGDDAVHAEEVLTITGCSLAVSTCYEGLEAHEIYVTGGDLRLVCTDDGINAAGGNDDSNNEPPQRHGGHGGNSTGVVAISGGNLYLRASGDGIDANGSLSITGGYTVVCGPTRGDTAVLDYDNQATVAGCTFIGTGSVMMAQTMTSNSGQGVVAVYNQGGFTAGTKITLSDTSGKVLITYTPELPFQLVILTTPEMRSGTEYTLTVGDVSAPVKAN